MRISLLTTFGAALLASSAQALYDKNSPVLELTAQNFKEEVLNNGVSNKAKSFKSRKFKELNFFIYSIWLQLNSMLPGVVIAKGEM